MKILRRVLPIVCLTLAAGCSRPQQASTNPEGATGFAPKSSVVATRSMVVAAHPLATQAGREILRAGGSAVDAAIAVQLVLGLVEPQSSGLGGGAFILHWDAARKHLTTYDGRETAPAAAQPDRFIRDGKPLPFPVAARSGLSVGVPGAVRALEMAHRKHGKLRWTDAFTPARKLADAGFPIGARLSALLARENAQRLSPAARSYFFSGGRPKTAGTMLRNLEYGATLDRLAALGAEALHKGPVAEAIVEAVTKADLPGDISLADLDSYRPVERQPVCAPYRKNAICSMGAPSSGGIAVGQTLMLLDGFDLGRSPKATMNPQAVHLFAEALKLAFADRNAYLADPAFVPQPAGLLDPGYLSSRRALMSPRATMQSPDRGLPPGLPKAAHYGSDETSEAAGTSHISIIDEAGNAVSMTTTIESAFGSGLWAAGFLLNNQLTDFSFTPVDRAGRPAANRIEPRKRPRSSMSPAMVFDRDGKLILVTGSPGGSRIIPYVAKTLIGILDWQLNAADAGNLPNIATAGNIVIYEPRGSTLTDALAHPDEWFRTMEILIDLNGYGQTVRLEEMTSGIHTIRRLDDGKLEGGADARREGIALGD